MVAVPGIAAATVLLVMAVLLATRAVELDLVLSELAAALLWAVGGVLVLLRTPGALRRPGRHAVALWVSPTLGAVGWIGTVGASQFVPGASKLSWAMNGDGFNNLFYANRILTDHGLALGQAENPVPLPATVLALAMAPGRSELASNDLLGHDLASLTVVWTLVLAVTCILTGAVVASAIPVRSPVAVAVASALGSLLPLTWYLAGLPAQWGYFNASVVLPILLSTWLVFLASRRFPVAALVALSGLTTLVIATWAPLVLVPGCLGIAVLVRDWKRIRALQGLSALALVLGAVQVLAWVGVVTVPTFLAQGGALEVPGHGFPSTWPEVSLLLIGLVALALLLRGKTSIPVVPGMIAIVVAAVATSAMLLFLDHGQGDPWTAYYPTKLAWIISALLVMVVLSLVVSIVERSARGPRTATAGIASVVGLALLVTAAVPVDGWQQTVVRQPMIRILSGSIWHTGDRAATQILALTDPRAPGILWQSNDPDEAMIDFWVLVTRGGDLAGDPVLRAVAFVAYRSYRATGTYDNSDPRTLCAILSRMKPTPTVHTASPALEAELRDTCPTSSARVFVDRR